MNRIPRGSRFVHQETVVACLLVGRNLTFHHIAGVGLTIDEPARSFSGVESHVAIDDLHASDPTRGFIRGGVIAEANMPVEQPLVGVSAGASAGCPHRSVAIPPDSGEGQATIPPHCRARRKPTAPAQAPVGRPVLCRGYGSMSTYSVASCATSSQVTQVRRRPPARRAGMPSATRNMTLLSRACGAKNAVTSSSKNVRPVAPRRCP